MSSLEKCFAMAKDNESARKGGVTDGRVGKERERERERAILALGETSF